MLTIWMLDMAEYLLIGLAIFAAVFVAEAVYALFFRNFGVVPFRLAFDVPGADAETVWSTYFDTTNAWNSVNERLSYEVVSEEPRIVRVRSRLRRSSDPPVTIDMRLDIGAPGRSCRASSVAVNGAPQAADAQTYEVFELAPGESGTMVKVEAGIPVRGWLWVPLHKRNLERIYQDLRIACLQKAGAPLRVGPRLGWR